MDWTAAFEFGERLMEKGGSLGVLVVCVGMFLVYLWRKGVQDAETDADRHASIERMGEACHTAHVEVMDRVDVAFDRTIKALDRNTEAFGRTSVALDQVIGERHTREPRGEKPHEPS